MLLQIMYSRWQAHTKSYAVAFAVRQGSVLVVLWTYDNKDNNDINDNGNSNN